MFIARLLVTGIAISIVSTAAEAGQHAVAADFNGDGKADLAIGSPFENLGTVSDCGVVHVLYGRGSGVSATNDDFWHENKPGVLDDPEAFDHFGRAVAAGDFDNDGFDDLAIATDENFGEGSVHVLYGSPNGLVTLGNRIFTQATSSGGEVGTHGFGASLAVGDFDDDGFDDLAIGEPNDTVNFASSAGSVTVVYGSPSGLSSLDDYWHQQLEGVGDTIEFGDGFGSSLAVGDYDGDGIDDLAVGAPGENVGNVLDAGVVQIIFGSPSGLISIGSELWQQNTPGIADAIESGDFFGATLAAGDFNADGRDDLAIGVPFEKISSRVHAGVVHVLYGSGGGLRAAGDDFWHQERSGIPDSSERDDEFGVALVSGDFDSDGFDDLAISAAREGLEVEEFKDCGAITVLYGTPSGLKTTAVQFWHLEQVDMPGEPDNARFGSSLTAGDFDGDGFIDLAATAPGESLDAVDRAGAVHILYGTAAQLTAAHGHKWFHQNIAGVADECETDDGFGGNPPPAPVEEK